MTIKVLDKNTIQSLHSGQVIVDLEAILKELVENSLDAQSTLIDLLFVENGLDSIEVRDNGHGIEEQDRLCAAKRHYTSKLKDFNDLESIESYGFRGEAINSICAISENFSFTTKTKVDIIGKQYKVDKDGNLSNEKTTNSIATCGTIMTLHRPFYNLPVRRQLATKNANQSMKKVQDLVFKYALAHPNVRFTIKKNNGLPWVKPATTSIESTLAFCFGAQIAEMLDRIVKTDTFLTVEALLPKPNTDPQVIYKNSNDRVFIYVNQRPINYVKSELKELVSMIKNRYSDSIAISDINKKTPFIYLDIQVPPNEYDVNIEPNKTVVLFHNKQRVFNLVESILDELYLSKTQQFFNSARLATGASKNNIPPDITSQSDPMTIPTANTDQEENAFSTQENIAPKANNWTFSMASDDSEMVDELMAEYEPSKKAATTTLEQWQLGEDTSSIIAPHEKQHAHQVSTIEKEEEAPVTTTTITSAASSSAPPSITSILKQINNDDSDRITVTPPYSAPRKQAAVSPLVTLPRYNKDTSTTPPPNTSTHLPQKRHRALLETREDDEEVLFIHPPLPPPSSQSRQQRKIPSLLTTHSLFKRANNSIHTDNNSRPMTDTLNHTIQINCNLASIQASYPKRKELLEKWYRVKIDDYLDIDNNEEENTGEITMLIKEPTVGLKTHGLSMYAKQSTFNKSIMELGVIKCKQLYMHEILNNLIKDHKVICKKSLDRPVQIIISIDDPLCASLLSLMGKEQFVANDMHGNTSVTYTELTDPNIVHNGFKARWRKDAVAGNMVVQFTAIQAIESGYGPADFREILDALVETTAESKMLVRPKKMIDYLSMLASEIYGAKEDDEVLMKQDLEIALKGLKWREKNESSWCVGYGNQEEILACKLSGKR